MHVSMCVSAWRAAADHNILLGTYVLCACVRAGMDAGGWRSGGATEGVGAPGCITCPIFVLAIGGGIRRRCFPLAGSAVVLSVPLCYSE